jgi:hypothetical protein
MLNLHNWNKDDLVARLDQLSQAQLFDFLLWCRANKAVPTASSVWHWAKQNKVPLVRD